MEKRYVVYAWDEDAQKSYADDYARVLTDSLEEGRLDVIYYEDELGEFDNEDDAYACADKYYDAHGGLEAIYDREEKYLFFSEVEAW
jgi:hypothetical protein